MLSLILLMKQGHLPLRDVLNKFIALKMLENLAMPSKSAPMALKTREIVTATARKAPDSQESPPKRGHPLLRDVLNTFMALKLLEILAMPSKSAPMALKTREIVTTTKNGDCRISSSSYRGQKYALPVIDYPLR